ncbi:unnamed protein product, partial [Ectocarpus sp. 8 AP-2014]
PSPDSPSSSLPRREAPPVESAPPLLPLPPPLVNPSGSGLLVGRRRSSKSANVSSPTSSSSPPQGRPVPVLLAVHQSLALPMEDKGRTPGPEVVSPVSSSTSSR